MSDTNEINTSQLLIDEIGRLARSIEKLDERLRNIEPKLAVLEVKSGVWGVIGGALVLLIPIVVKAVSNGFGQ